MSLPGLESIGIRSVTAPLEGSAETTIVSDTVSLGDNPERVS